MAQMGDHAFLNGLLLRSERLSHFLADDGSGKQPLYLSYRLMVRFPECEQERLPIRK